MFQIRWSESSEILTHKTLKRNSHLRTPNQNLNLLHKDTEIKFASYRFTSVKAPWGNIRDGAAGVRNIEISVNIPIGVLKEFPTGILRETSYMCMLSCDWATYTRTWIHGSCPGMLDVLSKSAHVLSMMQSVCNNWKYFWRASIYAISCAPSETEV